MKWYDPWFMLADMFLMLLASLIILFLDLKDRNTAADPEAALADAKAAFWDRFHLIKTTPKNWGL